MSEAYEHVLKGVVFFIQAFLLLGFISAMTIAFTGLWRWINKEKK